MLTKSDYMIDLSSWFKDSITYGKIMKIHQAIRDRQCLKLEYISKESRSVRIVEPHKLIFKQSQWYLYAYCRQQKGFRLFKIWRIVSWELLKSLFIPRPIDEIGFENDYGRGLFNPDNEDKVFEIILEYDIADEFALTDKIDASLLKRRPADGGNSGEIRFTTADIKRTADFIMGFADKVRIISPPLLKQEIKAVQ